ncbi:MAG: hypothetical protein Q9213_007757, partial [Squamulea squamosa]
MADNRRLSMHTTHFRQSSEPPDHRSSSGNVEPSSALLQDLLREKKASKRVSRISEFDDAINERQVQSSPIGPSVPSKPHPRRTSGLTIPKDMGVREMEEYISKLNKQNFDLKLEIFHRRQRTDVLETKAAKAAELEAQNDELRQLNDDLLQELEKRDIAVGEAVSLICELEAKVERLEDEQQYNIRPVTPVRNNDSDPEAREHQHVDASKSKAPSPSSVQSSGPSCAARNERIKSPDPGYRHEEEWLLRSPSFLSDNKPSTSALRSLFQSHDKGSTANGFGLSKPSIQSLRRVGSPFSQDDFPDTLDGETFSLNPRRLSLLSESSFVSVYGQNNEKITPSHARNRSLNASPPGHDDTSNRRLSPEEGRIRQWIENRDHPASPSKKPIKSATPDAFSSIGEILRPNRLDPRNVPQPASPTRSSGRHQRHQVQQREKADTKPSFTGPIYGPDALPPTPGTMSSGTLGGRSSNHSIVVEKSLTDGLSRPTTGHTSNLSHTRSHGSKGGLGPMQDEYPQMGPFDDDTDIKISADDKHPAYRENPKQWSEDLDDESGATPMLGDSVKASRVLGSNGAQRPQLSSYATDTGFNGETIESNRPLRGMSYPSPGRSHQAAIQNDSESPKKTAAGSRDGRESSTQQVSTTKPSLPRSLSSLSHSTAHAPIQTLTSRLFRKNPSSTLPAPTQPETTSPESKIRLPRPSSLYARTTSNPPLSLAATMKVPHPSRPGTTGGPDPTRSDSERLNGGSGSSPDQSHRLMADSSAGDGEQQQLVPQQNKRLSVGAIGRSASLRIKEG